MSVPIDQLLCLPDPLTPAKGFSCSETNEPIPARGVLQDLHRDHLMVGAHVRVLEDGGHLVLVGGHLVVACLDRHAQLGELHLGIEHAREDALGDRPEVVVVELVALGGLCAEQRSPCGEQVGTLEVVLLVDQEVLLLASDRREHALSVIDAEQL